jgi:hypothetical protein
MCSSKVGWELRVLLTGWGRKIKTAEIVINEGPWETNPHRVPGNKLVQIRIDYDETYLGRVVKGTGDGIGKRGIGSCLTERLLHWG